MLIKCNAFMYIYYNAKYIDRVAFYFNGQNYNELQDLIKKHLDKNKCNINKNYFNISTKNECNIKNYHNSKYKELAKYNPINIQSKLKIPNVNSSYDTYTFKEKEINLFTRKNDKILYEFIATIVCINNCNNNAIFSESLQCIKCYKGNYNNENIIGL